MSASGLSRNSSAIDLFRPATRADYRYLGLLGQGQFAQIYCAVYRRTGQLVAIKETRHAPQRASQEPFILQTLAHPNVIGCQSIAKTKIGHRLVLEYCEAGTLRSHLKGTQNTSDSLPLGDTQLLMTDLLEGLSYLHQCGIAHGDLKPENLLLTWKTPLSNNQKNHKANRKKGRTQNRLGLKIGDFGSAVFLDKSGRSSEHDLSNQTSISQKTAYREMGSP
ncbi:MAG: protein kinase, partial [Cyanobacteria bacterium J06555_13]